MFSHTDKLSTALLKGDYFTSWHIIQQHINDGLNTYFIFDNVIRNAMYEIGQMWEENLINVADEHLATSICDYVLTRYGFSNISQTGIQNRAMVFCIEGEDHYLGAKMAASVLQEAGWQVQYLGPNLPLEFALYSARKWKPEVIGLSVSLTLHLPKLKEYITALEQLPHKPTVIVGSRLLEKYDFTPYITKTTVTANRVTDLQQFIEQHMVNVNE
ncbi:cobalamin B12-binding domain-containing protein [Bacillus alkalicellulosilyticus]|uniref:cobalamin B12-binding domain-containing protein n=1 Tax=Alkalihalobacterium alkalicellulosilyticum TaxID=1912214 RepID=UPI00099896DD|nr:cobalamin B12-binding domain-containing protein [Bacillus alkalicellulosilyticus]